MKKLILPAVVLASVFAVACKDGAANKTKDTPAVTTSEELAKRGKYLVDIMVCDDCHSPKIMTPHGPVIDTTRRLSGHPSDMKVDEYDEEALNSWVLFNSKTFTSIAGQWGVSFAANLTSDATGIGSWTEAQFLKAIREGKYKGLDNSRPLLPPMPWEQYSKASDEDLKAIFAFLKTTKPVHNVVPPPIPPKKG